MKVRAPGKLLLTGGYAVLEGARAIVCAIDRYAVASGDPAGSGAGAVSPEVMAAMEGVGAETPHVDTSSLFSKGQKLGLGSSAAAVVAALGRIAALRGEHLGDAGVRQEIFDRARTAHARVQSGGSGVDVAASVYGGVLCYSLRTAGRPSVSRVDLPEGLSIDAYWSGHSVRTSEMRARVDRLKLRDKDLFAARMGELSEAAEAAASAIDQGDVPGLIEAAQASARGLFALGRDADTPIVPPSAHGLVRLADEERSAFLPSGAGGGDVFVRLAQGAPSQRFAKEAEAAGLEKLDFAVDILGVHTTGKLRGEPSP